MDPIDGSNDLELLAALADGRLSGKDRERAIKLLADSDEALELFANTLRDQPAVAPVAAVVPITSARRWRQWKVVLPVVAAAALAFVLVPRVTGRSKGGVSAREYATELTRDPRFARLPEGWDQHGWTVRGGGSQSPSKAGSAVESKLAFRLGVRTVDLEVALRRGDTALAGRLATELTQTLDGVAFAQPVAARYSDLKSAFSTGSAGCLLDRSAEAESELRDLLGTSGPYVFGQWVGAADLAAQARDAAFFESEHSTRFIRAANPEGSLSEDDEKALRSIDERVTRGLDDRALEEIHNSLEEVIRQRGG